MIVDWIMQRPEGSRLMILAPIIRGKKGHHKEVFEAMLRQGFVRARVDGEVMDLREITQSKTGSPFTTQKSRYQQHSIEAVVDRVVIRDRGSGAGDPEESTDSLRTRVADSVELALRTADGLVIVSTQQRDEADPIPNPRSPTPDPWQDQLFSENYACPLHPECSLEDMEPRLFSFNSPYGACPECGGLGNVLEFDEELIVPDPSLSLTNGAIEAWRKGGTRMNIYYNRLVRKFCRDFKASAEKPFKDLPEDIQRILLHGTTKADEKKYDTHFEGVIHNLQRRFESSDSDWVKQRLHAYLSAAPCETCHGARLRTEALHVYLHADEEQLERTDEAHAVSAWADTATTQDAFNHAEDLDKNDRLFNLHDVTSMTIEHADAFFSRLRLSAEGQHIAQPILKEVRARLGFMMSVGLSYLSLNRATQTLSGGEAQRIRLATQVGSGLVGCCYVLDEPTIGLHQRDNDRLIKTLRHLTDIGNTVLVVEHDEDTIRAADQLIDIGPGPRAARRERRRPGHARRVSQRFPRHLPHRPVSGRRRVDPDPRTQPAQPQEAAQSHRLPGKQPQKCRLRRPHRRAGRRHRRERVG